MKKYKQFKKAFGIDDYGFPMIPKKYSNIKISRIKNTDNMGGCSFCFPHGIECTNSSISKIQKNWKSYRKKQYKTKKDNNTYYKSKEKRKHVKKIFNMFEVPKTIIL